jgi:hypothetical protein
MDDGCGELELNMATSISSFVSRDMSWPVPPLPSRQRRSESLRLQTHTRAFDKREGLVAIFRSKLQERGREMFTD